MTQPLSRLTLLAGLIFGTTGAFASDPASHELTAPSVAGDSITVSWTGTALAGASGAANSCTQGTDDSHDIILAVPEGLYDDLSVQAAFHIEWTPGAPDPTGTVNDPDLVLTVVQDGTELGSSDGSSPEENVTITNPEAGTLTAIVCPFFATAATDYSATLTLTAVGQASCVMPPSSSKSHALSNGNGGDFSGEQLRLPNFDLALLASPTNAAPAPVAGYAGRIQSALYDRALQKPTFLWASTATTPISAAPLASEQDRLVSVARAHLAREAKLLKLTPQLIDQAEVVNAQFNGNGPAVVRLRQRVNGVEVFKRYLNVLIDRDYKPVAVSGYFATDFDATAVSDHFPRGPAQAISAAWASLGGVLDATKLTVSELVGEYTWFEAPLLTGSHVFERRPRSRPVYYAHNNELVPAHYVELFTVSRATGSLSGLAMVVSAVDGRILNRKNLISAADYSYRVFADVTSPNQPYDSPLGNSYSPFSGNSPLEPQVRTSASTQLVTLESGPISTGDPWLADGATETVGNNVEACLDYVDTPVSGLISNPLNTCDPALGDVYGSTNGSNSFDYDMVADTDPAVADTAQAAVVNLFYINNWLHDWWYDHGFDEASGNAQLDNYGRGGAEGDPIRAQGQDASGRNNANMGTPADGSSPTMQQYLFDGPTIGEVRQLAPSEGESLKFTGAAFGPAEYDVTGVLVLANDGAGDSTSDGCGIAPPDPGLPVALPAIPGVPDTALLGNIALIDRGSCNFTTKVQFALASGAIGMIVVNNTDGEPISMGNGDVPVDGLPVSPTDTAYNVPSVMIRKADGDALKAQLESVEVSMRMQREPSIDLDGTLDNQIIAHEFFHYVHNRLADVGNQQSSAMGEGWGDIDGFMLSARADDILQSGNDRYQGAYGLAGYVTTNFYFGIRRAPYSTQFSDNGFTFRHISDGVATPDGGTGASNSAVHSAGEIWANMMWECYVGLLNDPRHSFAEAQNRMKDYIIGGLKMTPADATYTEARDAVLSVVRANDFEDFAVCSDGFAKRGAGLLAVAPSRDSVDLVGAVEDYTPFVCGRSLPGVPGSPANPGTGSNGDRFGGGALSASLLWLLLSLALGGRAWTRRRDR